MKVWTNEYQVFHTLAIHYAQTTTKKEIVKNDKRHVTKNQSLYTIYSSS